jgi:nitroimidazol reductase NimA-like FMN-containing flavoprotein (pyridoxamine 5'-phosphate oxidase superfamily)
MADYTPTDRTQLRRRPQRGHYDKATVHAILDSEMMAHVSYLIDGEARITPTSYWREGDTLYWHGSRAARGIEAQAKGIDVAFCVSRLDGFVLGRTGFSHSVNYSSVMVYGRTQAIDDIDDKAKAMSAFIDRLYPGRSATLRPYHKTELAQITVIAMPIEEAVAKIRTDGVNEKPDDMNFPAWAGVLRVAPRVLGVDTDARGLAQPVPASVDNLAKADTLQAALTRAARG